MPESSIAPDIGAIVEYGLDSFGKEPRRYRVSAWIREAPVPEFKEEDWLEQILFEACQGLKDRSDGKLKRMQFCLRHEATHLSLSGIAGAIAPISLCKVIGKVAWEEALLEDARRSANRKGENHEMIF